MLGRAWQSTQLVRKHSPRPHLVGMPTSVESMLTTASSSRLELFTEDLCKVSSSGSEAPSPLPATTLRLPETKVASLSSWMRMRCHSRQGVLVAREDNHPDANLPEGSGQQQRLKQSRRTTKRYPAFMSSSRTETTTTLASVSVSSLSGTPRVARMAPTWNFSAAAGIP